MERPFKQALLTAPGIGVALMPKLMCPMCWPFYAGILSSVGLGFLVSATYLLPFTIAFLILTLGVLAYRAKERRGYGPFLLGVLAAAAVLIGKFHLEWNYVAYSGVVILVVAAIWNGLPLRPKKAVCSSCAPDTTVQISGAHEREM
jgi:mercuric ion transport protein